MQNPKKKLMQMLHLCLKMRRKKMQNNVHYHITPPQLFLLRSQENNDVHRHITPS